MSAHRRVRAALARLVGLGTRGSDDARMHEEMAFHLERLAERYAKTGFSPDEARRRARIAFGGVSRNEEAARDQLRARAVDAFAQDVRFGVRSFVRTPILTAAAICTLTIGMGATTSLFGILDALILRRAPVPRPDRVYALIGERAGDQSESIPYPLFRALASSGALPTPVAGYAYRDAALGAWADTVAVQLTSDNWFATVSVAPRFGRAWGPGETDVAVLSDRIARRHFGRPSEALGTTLQLSGRLLTVVGVMPPGFAGLSLDYATDVWVPMALEPVMDGASEFGNANLNWVRTVLRLDRDQAPAAAAAANVVRARQRLALHAAWDSTERLVTVSASHASIHDRDQVARTLLLGLALVGLVLLIACANIANLQLARAAGRQRELAARLALGATRGRLVRQLLTESLLLAFVSGGAGLGLAFGLTRLLVSSRLASGLAIPLAGIDFRLALFAAGLSLGVAVVSGLAPAIHATRMDPAEALTRAGGPRGTPRSAGRNALLMLQVAASVILLATAGTLLRALDRLQTLDLGYDAHDLVQITVDWRQAPDATTRSVAGAIADRLRGTPGISGASTSVPAAYGRATITTSGFQIEGRASPVAFDVHFQSVSPEFFATTGLAVLRGRAFTTADGVGAPNVAIVNETAAQMLFPGAPAVGQRFPNFLGPEREIVGVVRDARIFSVAAPPPPIVYVPMAQVAVGPNPELRTIEVRLGPLAPSLEVLGRVAASASDGRPVTVVPLRETIAGELAFRRLRAWVTGALGLVGLVLALIGVYGLNAYLVTRRTVELGIRLALGASAGHIQWLVWRQAMRAVGLGAGVGLAVAVGAGIALRATVQGVTALAPGLALAVTLVVLVIAGLASYLPARRTTTVDPVAALKEGA